MADRGLLKLRLLRDTATAPGGDASDCAFGLQDNKDQIHSGTLREDGYFAFDFTLRVAATEDEAQPPIFTGPFAFGRPQDRFVYLAWQRSDGASYANRIKARLADIDWALVQEAQGCNGTLEADMSGRKAGGGKVPVKWRIVDAQEVVEDEAEM